MSAKEAYKAYVRAYDSHHLKTIFDVHTLDLTKVAHSFGFRVPPAVDLSKYLFLQFFQKQIIHQFFIDMRSTNKDRPRKRQNNFGGTGSTGGEGRRTSSHHTKSTMYRQMGNAKNDKRQFSR